MKSFYFVLHLLCLFSFGLQAQSLEQEDAEKIVPGAESVLMGEQSAVPTFVVLQEDRQFPVEKFAEWERQTFNYSEGITFTTRKIVEDEKGMTHLFRDQYYRGVPVDQALSVIHSRDGKVIYFNGDIHNELSLSATPAVEGEVARQAALKHHQIDPVTWDQVHPQGKSAEATDDHGHGHSHGHSHATQENNPTLVIYPHEGNYYLAWKINLQSRHFDAHQHVFVDAQKNEIINSVSTSLQCNGGGVTTTWRGNQGIFTDLVGGSFILHNDCAPRNIRTLNSSGNTDFTDADNIWTSTNLVTIGAQTAHWGVTGAFDYFRGVHNQIGMDGTGTVNVLITAGYTNAQFLPSSNSLEFGLGADGTSSLDDYTTPDYCGHEFTHGVMFNTGGITSTEHESLSLHEGISDIFGNEVQAFVDGGAPDWSHGDELADSDVRFLNNPNADVQGSIAGSPDTYKGNFWSGSSQHIDGGVVRYWYFLLSQGGTGINDKGYSYNLPGIGRGPARTILYAAISSGSFGANPNYFTARAATLAAAAGLYGSCSTRRNEVANAWRAVGVGGGLVPDISISNVTTSLGSNNNIAPQGTFSVNYSLSANGNSIGYTSTYVGAYIQSFCSFGFPVGSPFDVEVESIACNSTINGSSSLTLPSNLEPGTYAVVMKADAFDWIKESNEYNNSSCFYINVTVSEGVPDLLPTFASVSPSTVEGGNSVTASVALFNGGTAACGYSFMGYYLSTDQIYSSNDIYLGNKYFAGLNPGSASSGSRSLVIPSNTVPGTYYIVYRADYNELHYESNENNNYTARAITVTAPPSNLPDLVVTNISPSPSTGIPPTVYSGQYLTVNYTLTNQGSGTPGNTTTRIYFSTDNTVGGGDYLAKELYNQTLGSKSTTVQVYGSPQYQYIIIVTDYNNTVVEAYENNNLGFGHCIIGTPFTGGTNEEDNRGLINEQSTQIMTTTFGSENNSIELGEGQKTEISVFPNPAINEFTLKYPALDDQAVHISLYNSSGKMVSQRVLEAAEQTGQWRYNGQQLPSGLYFVHWQTDKETKVVKVIVE